MTFPDDLAKALIAECEKEPIHIPGSIQPFGILLTVESENLLISNISENCLEFWNRPAQDLIGHSFQGLLTADDVASLQNHIQHPNLKEQPALRICLPSARTGLHEIWNLHAHRHHDILFLELELELLSDVSDVKAEYAPFRNKIIEIVQSLQRAKSLQELCDSAVQQVTAISGFDRVMLYRFDSDFNGIVISEVTSPKVDSYLNHHFPATDIPAQARAIFLQNWLRMIPDVGYTPSRLYPGIDPHTGESLDLGQATLRSVSPIHLEYLQNMNVKATLTISLLEEGKLWGLIACHHQTPLLVNEESRLAAQLIGQIVSSQLRVKEELEDLQYKAELKSTHAALLSFMELEEDLVQGLVTHTPNLLNIANADGAAAAIYFNGEWTLIGKTPSISQIDDLVTWLSETHAKKNLFHTDSLSPLYPKANEYKEIASGVLAIAIPKSQRNYLLWFRPEVLTTVVWGGKPEKNVKINSGQARLHPRSSFESWAELVTGTATPWKKVEIEAVGELRNSIIALDLGRQFHKEQKARAVAETLARYDFLTNLPNRLLLNDRIAQAIEYAHRHHTLLALLFLDLDHFKHINDSLGHAVGDQLLQSVALRLIACVRSSDTVSRQGGDEFVILIAEEKQPVHTTLILDKILSAFVLPHAIAGNELHVTTSIGISIYPSDSHNAETLIKHADTAMYQAKQKGRNNYQFFQSEMNERAVERQLIETNLRRALEHREFVLHYQPKINLESGAITGAEALLRWNHPQWGIVLPERFVPVAEECGLIVPIGHWVLREACLQSKSWESAGLSPGSIAVNVSALEFRRKDFVESVRSILSETGLTAEHLQLEITESVLMRDAESSAAILQQLKQMGIQLAVDDFGTGYSSLSYLTQFPIDVLKIDQSFVHDIDADGGNNVIVSAIIAMGSSLHIRVVAEGVEESAQITFLKDRQCEEAQGYFLSRPVIGAQYAALLTNGISRSWP
jgi:diguanylate cyclase (GGDEF)-like protein